MALTKEIDNLKQQLFEEQEEKERLKLENELLHDELSKVKDWKKEQEELFRVNKIQLSFLKNEIIDTVKN